MNPYRSEYNIFYMDTLSIVQLKIVLWFNSCCFKFSTGVKEVPEEFQSDVMTLLQRHAKNEEKECRLTQPDLWLW